MKTLVATIESAPIHTNKALDKEGGTIPITNLRIAIKTLNRFGLEVVDHAKVVTFKAVAIAADKLGLKEGDHVFLDGCRKESRPYAKDGVMIPSTDIIANVVAKISAKEYASIAKTLAAEAKSEKSADDDLLI
jgi:hypothetical protein